MFLFSVFLFFFGGMPGYTQNLTDPISVYNTGRSLESQNRMNEAEFYYNLAIRLCNEEISRNAATANTYTALTWTLQRQKKYADVITWGERGLRLYADEYRIVEIMGEAYFYLDDYDRSLRFMQRYTNSLPRGERASIAYFFIGEIYRLRNQYYHADVAYSAAVQLEKNVALWWYRLALVREAAGDIREAIVAYQQAIALNSDYREAREGLARSLRQEGR